MSYSKKDTTHDARSGLELHEQDPWGDQHPEGNWHVAHEQCWTEDLTGFYTGQSLGSSDTAKGIRPFVPVGGSCPIDGCNYKDIPSASEFLEALGQTTYAVESHSTLSYM